MSAVRELLPQTYSLIDGIASFTTNGDERRWMKRAACRGTDTNLWFPDKGQKAQYDTAVAVCEQCPVQIRCAEYGTSEEYGIWGGMNLRTRRKWAKKQENNNES